MVDICIDSLIKLYSPIRLSRP